MTDHFDKLVERADLYRRVFGSEDGRAVLLDLKTQFSADESVFAFVLVEGHPRQLDVNYTLVQAAKRECFDYIAKICGLTYEDVVALKHYAQMGDDDV